MTNPQPSVGVLMLEDDDLDAELVAAQLRMAGLSTDLRRAQTEQQFLHELERGGVDLVLADFALPGYDGLAALDATRRLLPDLPFIFVSGAIGEERAIDTLQRGATDCVLKSRLERLPSAVTRALRLADELRRRKRAEAERDRLFESERIARAQAESANRMKDEFLAIASHELRTPLNAMLGWASLLSNAEPAPDLLQRGLGIIKRNALAQSRLIEDILDISRIVTGKLQLHQTRTSVASFVLAAVEAVRPAANAKNVAVTISIDAPEEINVDAERLQQVMWNLLSNAVKFTPSRGTVRVEVKQCDDSVIIAVTDDGQGIDPEFLPFVFDRFRQADSTPTRGAGGLGLGLSIVRYLVEAHGGRACAESAGPGQGARFLIKLPRKPTLELQPDPVPDAPKSERDAETLGTDQSALRGIRVLLVEDEPDSRELVALILRSSGADVVTVNNALEALQAFAAQAPDVVISDIGMPEMDGYALLRRVRSLAPSAGGNTPAIALTAYTRELDLREAELAGFQRHLSKPVSVGLLLRMVAETVASARADGARA